MMKLLQFISYVMSFHLRKPGFESHVMHKFAVSWFSLVSVACHTAVSTKVVQKKRKSIRDNTER